MAINAHMLAQQIQRLLVSDQDKTRLIDQLDGLSEEKKLELAHLIQDHDREAMQLLDQKAAEVDQLKGQMDALSSLPDDSEAELHDIMKELKTLLKDPAAFSQLVSECDDQQLRDLQSLIESGLAHRPEAVTRSQQFFQEVRLQKAAFTKEGREEQRQMMQEAIMATKEQNDKLEALIADAEKALGKKYS